ncbi:MAG: hypothetical protein C4294_19760 [Nitrospiraceae bacterium]
MSGILYVMRSGCQWNAMPEEYGWVTTAAPLLPTAVVIGVFKRMWQAGLSEFDELKGIAWQWQAADGAMTQAPLGGDQTGKNPTERSKTGTNRPDGKLLGPTLLAVPIERPDSQTRPQHLCLDKAYSGAPCTTLAAAAGYTLHVPAKANAKKTQASARTPQSPSLDCRSRGAARGGPTHGSIVFVVC